MTGFPDVEHVRRAAEAGDIGALEEIAALLDGFPAGSTEWPVVEPWIVLIATCGTPSALNWALSRGAPVDPEVDDGFPPLHALIDAPIPHRHENMAILIAAGADVNRRGINDWTPLHHAAVRDDTRAIQLLLDCGADRDVRTRIDNCTTPEEEARLLGHARSADFIRDYGR